jgi:hypothetical protein
MPANCQQQLVLSARETGSAGLLLAPAQEPAQAGTKLEQSLIVTILECHIVLRYRYAIYCAGYFGSAWCSLVPHAIWRGQCREMRPRTHRSVAQAARWFGYTAVPARADTRRCLMSRRTADEGALEHKAEGVVRALPSIISMHVGRFSEGIEQLPETRAKRHVGRFSEGMERRPATPAARHIGRFSEGMEQVGEAKWKLRRGTFADGLRNTGERSANASWGNLGRLAAPRHRDSRRLRRGASA